MIQHLSQLELVHNKIQNSTNAKQFNAALPVTIEVSEQTHSMRYMLKIGNTTMETKSLKELIIGGKYWAEMNKSSQGSIILSNLILQPSLLDYKNPALRLPLDNLKALFEESKGNPAESLKQFLSERLAQASDRNEFLFLSNMLLSLSQHVLTIPLSYDEGKNGYMQLRRKKKENTGEEFLEFYSVFAHLGAIEGKLFSSDGQTHLQLLVLYEQTKRFLDESRDDLAAISHISIGVDNRIVPFYDFSHSLLDMKG